VARSIQKTCDICGSETDVIVAKLHFIPMQRGVPLSHSNYTMHADVGTCCEGSIRVQINFQPRKSQREYHESRRAG